MLPMRPVFINVKKGISELSCWLAAKHTTLQASEIVAKYGK